MRVSEVVVFERAPDHDLAPAGGDIHYDARIRWRHSFAIRRSGAEDPRVVAQMMSDVRHMAWLQMYGELYDGLRKLIWMLESTPGNNDFPLSAWEEAKGLLRLLDEKR